MLSRYFLRTVLIEAIKEDNKWESGGCGDDERYNHFRILQFIMSTHLKCYCLGTVSDYGRGLGTKNCGFAQASDTLTSENERKMVDMSGIFILL